jgi:hypothetical protein
METLKMIGGDMGPQKNHPNIQLKIVKDIGNIRVVKIGIAVDHIQMNVEDFIDLREGNFEY